jgi:hypothetical protein
VGSVSAGLILFSSAALENFFMSATQRLQVNDNGEEQCDYGELLPAGQTGARRPSTGSPAAAAGPPPVFRDRKPSDLGVCVFTYIYIYIYMCVCVCVCVCAARFSHILLTRTRCQGCAPAAAARGRRSAAAASPAWSQAKVESTAPRTLLALSASRWSLSVSWLFVFHSSFLVLYSPPAVFFRTHNKGLLRLLFRLIELDPDGLRHTATSAKHVALFAEGRKGCPFHA